MKKLILTFGSILLLNICGQSQVTVTQLGGIDTVYTDFVELDNGQVAGIRFHGGYAIDLFDFDSTGPGALTQTIPLTGNGETLLKKGDWLYALNYDLQAIDLSNISSPQVHPVQWIPFSSIGAAVWDDLLLSLHYLNGFEYRFLIYSTVNPAFPVVVDSMDLPAEAAFTIHGNTLYYLMAGQNQGQRIRRYQLSASAPYLSLVDSFALNNLPGTFIPLIETSGDKLFANVDDSLYQFHIQSSGALQLESRNMLPPGGIAMAAIDSLTLCFNNYQTLTVWSIPEDTMILLDSTTGFQSFRHMGKLGDILFYNDMLETRFLKIRKEATHTPGISALPRIIYGPNPVKDFWQFTSESKGQMMIFNSQGQMIERVVATPAKPVMVPTEKWQPGNYFFRFVTEKGVPTHGKLIKL